MPGFPVDSAEANARPFRVAPACGQDTLPVLRSVGYSDEDIAALRESRAIHVASPCLSSTRCLR